MSPWSLLALMLILGQSDGRIPTGIQQANNGILLVEWLEGTTPAAERDFYVNGEKESRGKTNTLVPITAGTYTIRLGTPLDYTPAKHKVTVLEKETSRVTFKKIGSE